jgi:peptidyl-prolyl cis-trans isomerase D
VSGRDKREVKIVDLALRVRASTQTIDEAFQRAQDFSYLAKEEGYEKAAENSKYTIQETPEFQKTGTIYGIGYNEAVTDFAFANKLGTISDPIHIQSGVAVFKVSSIREEGLRSLDEVRNIVQSMALRDKKMMKLRGQVDEFYKTLTPSSDLITAAQSIPNLIAQKTGPFTPATFPAGVGRDLKFIGTALSLKSGELSKPADGNRGFYIIKLLSRTEIDTVKYDVQRASLREQLLQEKRNRAISDWQTALREKAEIVDHRDKFYQ